MECNLQAFMTGCISHSVMSETYLLLRVRFSLFSMTIPPWVLFP